MKVSVREVNAPTISEYYWSSGGVITRLSKDGKGYAAIYKVDVLDLEVTYMCYIYIMIGNNGWEVVNSERLPGKIKTINITATGTNPVYISAWFDSYHLEYYDYKYKLTGEYGGMWVLCTMKGTFYMDDFVEETTMTDIETGSIGCIKALFK